MKLKIVNILTPIILSTFFVQLLALALTYAYSFTPISEQTYAPFGNETPAQAVENSISLLIPIFIASVFIVLIIILRRFLFLKTFLTSAVALSAFLLTGMLLDSILPKYIQYSDIVTLIISLFLASCIFLVVYVKKLRFLARYLSLFIGAEAGALFATILKPPTAFVFPILVAMYDIYAVFKGPLKKVVSGSPKMKGKPEKVNLDFLSLQLLDFGFVRIGLGDIVFYSMIPSISLLTVAPSLMLTVGLFRALLTMIATNIGVILTMVIFMKKKIALPGLPIPMLLGVATSIILSII